MNESGTVMMSFVVEKNGVISHVRILNSLFTDLDDEAKRIVRAMPNWTPATRKELPVRTLCKLPIIFTLG